VKGCIKQEPNTHPSPHVSRHVTPLLVTPLPVHVTTAPIESYMGTANTFLGFNLPRYMDHSSSHVLLLVLLARPRWSCCRQHMCTSVCMLTLLSAVQINYMLMLGCVAMVAGFQDTTALGHAYGVAVMSVMFMTTILAAIVMMVCYGVNPLLVSLFLLFFGGWC